MKLQRFLPLLLILALLGGAGYIANENPEWFLDEHEIRDKRAYGDLISSIESGLTEWRKTPQLGPNCSFAMKCLATTPSEKERLIPDIAVAAWTHWTAAYNAWRKSSTLANPPNAQLNELELLLDSCQGLASRIDDIQHHRSVMNAGSKLFNEGPSGI